MLWEVITAPDHRLRLTASPVIDLTNIGSLVDRMRAIMHASSGIGLAATQIGAGSCVIVVNVPDTGSGDIRAFGSFEMINPTIISRLGTTTALEGCLSIPGILDAVERSSIIDVSFMDVFGGHKTITASGLLSACIQHEIDHLDGVLFIDRLSRLKKDIALTKMKRLKRLVQGDELVATRSSRMTTPTMSRSLSSGTA